MGRRRCPARRMNRPVLKPTAPASMASRSNGAHVGDFFFRCRFADDIAATLGSECYRPFTVAGFSSIRYRKGSEARIATGDEIAAAAARTNGASLMPQFRR